MKLPPGSLEANVGPPQLMGEPDSTGRFGNFGGRFVPEALVPACQDLERDFRASWSNDAFKERYNAVAA